MSKSNNNGRAYEFACLNVLEKRIAKMRSVVVDYSRGYNAAKNAWDTLEDTVKSKYTHSAESFVDKLFELEPRIIENSEDCLDLSIQTDDAGIVGDVRDLLIIRQSIDWEIGLSVKRNHFAVKHSRLSGSNDFGKKWFNIPCSNEYWAQVGPVFTKLNDLKSQGVLWSDLDDKEDTVYVPILNAFTEEVKRQYKALGQNASLIPKKMVEYLLGRHDFYKIVSIDRAEYTQIQGFNLRGTLNKSVNNEKNKTDLPIAELPNKILFLDFNGNSKTTVILALDEGWQFSFRIHNASRKVEPSLKFDIQITGMPTSISTFDCPW